MERSVNDQTAIGIAGMCENFEVSYIEIKKKTIDCELYS